MSENLSILDRAKLYFWIAMWKVFGRRWYPMYCGDRDDCKWIGPVSHEATRMARWDESDASDPPRPMPACPKCGALIPYTYRWLLED